MELMIDHFTEFLWFQIKTILNLTISVTGQIFIIKEIKFNQ
jgi:hypothetical protein